MRLRLGRKYRYAGSVAVLAVSVTIGLVGCTAPHQPVSKISDGADSSVVGIDKWVMPLDEFRVYPPQLDNYAEQLEIGKCMSSGGYSWPVPWQDTNFPQPEDMTMAGARFFTMDLAKRFGYHMAPAPNMQDVNAWSAFIEKTTALVQDAAVRAEFQSCLDSVRSKDGLKFMDSANYISELGMQASSIAKQAPDVQTAVKAWRDCLTPKVNFVVPEDPWTEMPPLAVGEKFGIAGPNQTASPSQEEIASATADAECRESSKVTAEYYTAMKSEQQKLIDKNRDKLDRIRRDATQHKKDLLQIVAENAPAAP